MIRVWWVAVFTVVAACDDHLFQAEGGDAITADWCGVQPVLADSCATSGCHAASSAAGGLDLESDAYAALVEAPSTGEPSLQLVTPGDPDASILLQKVEGTQTVGARMPPGTPLTDDTLAAIRTWIADGATDCEGTP